MADEHAEDNARPSLEPPRLLGRRRRRAADPQASEPEPAAPQAATAERTTETTLVSEPVFEPVAEPAAEPTAEPAGAPTTPARRTRSARLPRRAGAGRSLRMPTVPGQAAAVISGVLVGAVLLALVLLGFQGCEALQGSDSCGTGPGMVALVIVFALACVAGRFLLAAFGVPDPGSTSFLAVGLTSVVALLFFIDVLDTWPMIVVIPAISGATYLLSWWVTTTYVEPSA